MTGSFTPLLSLGLLVLCSVNYELGCDLGGHQAPTVADAGGPVDGGPADSGAVDAGTGASGGGDAGAADGGDAGSVDAGSVVIAVDATSSAYSKTSPLTWTHTVGAAASNTVLLVGVTLGSGPIADATSVTYSGVPLTEAIVRVGNPVVASMWYLVNPPPGAHAVVVTFSGTPDTAAGALSLSGVDQSNPIPTVSGGTQLGGTVSQAITTQFPASWVVDAMALIVPGATQGGSQVLDWRLTAGPGTGQGSHLVTTSPGLYTTTWTGPGGADESAVVVVEVKP